MPLLPKEPTDLALAPVAVQIDRNLAQDPVTGPPRRSATTSPSS